MKKLFLGLFSLASALLLSGCANQKSLTRATAFSMGLEPHQVEVSDISVIWLVQSTEPKLMVAYITALYMVGLDR